MATKRIERINSDMQRELSDVLRNLKDPRLKGKMISVTGVEVSGDLRYAKSFISVLGENEDVMQGLKSAAGLIRREMGQRVKLRQTPEFIFIEDNSMEYGSHIDNVLKGLNV